MIILRCGLYIGTQIKLGTMPTRERERERDESYNQRDMLPLFHIGLAWEIF